MMDKGYYSPEYANSFSEFGEVLQLPNSGLSVLKREIDGQHFDVAGLYPFSACDDWLGLRSDIEYLRSIQCVSLVLVVDPLLFSDSILGVTEWTVSRPFKTHFISDLEANWQRAMSKSARKYCRRGCRLQQVETYEGESRYAELFWSLYQQSISRHDMSGIQRMSVEAIRCQLQAPGAELFIAKKEGRNLGAMIAFNQGDIANLHLMGLSEESYECSTSYALIYSSLRKLQEDGCRQVNLGGATGTEDNIDNGLFQFKRRMTNSTRIAWMFGQILEPQIYDLLNSRAGFLASDRFFPAYRFPGGMYQ